MRNFGHTVTKLQDHIFFDAASFFGVNRKKSHIFRNNNRLIMHLSLFCAPLLCFIIQNQRMRETKTT